MAYIRTEIEPLAWLKSVGTQEQPLRADWRVDVRRDDDGNPLETNDHLLNRVWFNKHPRSIRAGDFLVYYAVRHGSLVAIAEVASDDVRDENDERFKFSMSVRPIVTLGLREAPQLAETPIKPTSVRRQSHIKMEPDAFAIARKLIFESAERSIPEIKA
jgi:hypothetical protein